MYWIKKNKFEFTIFLGIVILTLLLRFYKIDQYMTFLGDEGRDAIVVKEIVTKHHFPLIGAPTSVGNMYLGPLYYYMMFIPMSVSGFNPVAAAVLNAVIGTLTVILIYYLLRTWFGVLAAVFASVLYSLSPINIIYSRTSWNPNPAPFFALLAILGLFKTHQTKNFKWFIISGISLAFAIQMHYLALILLPIIGILWIYEVVNFRENQKNLIFGSVVSTLSFLLLMLPLLMFDLRHDFMNYKAFANLVFSPGNTAVGLDSANPLGKLPGIYQRIYIEQYMSPNNEIASVILSILVLIPLVVVLYRKLVLKRGVDWGFLALFVWLFVGMWGVSLFKGIFYAHYLGFINPVAYLLLGSLFGIFGLVKNSLIKKGLVLALAIFLIIIGWINIDSSPLKVKPNNQLYRTQKIAKFVIGESKDRPYNFALISEHNYDAAYQFYLEEYRHPPLKLPDGKADQLIVVCEDPVCKPVGHSKYEIAAFGWTKIASEFSVEGVRIFKLVNNPDQLKL